MPRREFSKAVKVAAFQRANGRCEECTGFLVAGKFHYDHDIADGLGGEPTLENCKVLCVACHGAKTAGNDVPKIAKSKRQAEKNAGARPKRKGRPLPGTKASGWKHKADGTWIRRGA